jgi:arylsulfatase A-like enzyme
MDASFETIFTFLRERRVLDDTIVVINADHGETLYEHECWYDHHGLYDSNLHVPLIIRYPPDVPVGRRVSGFNQHKDLMPTLLELARIDPGGIGFYGQSLMPMLRGQDPPHSSEIYITECTWMRKHGWRTPQWKLIVALEPDFHFKPPVELYDLVEDPKEVSNLADAQLEVVAMLRQRMDR